MINFKIFLVEIKMTEFKIPIRDREGNVKFAIVSQDHHEELNKYKQKKIICIN